MVNHIHESLRQFVVPIHSIKQALVNPRTHDKENLDDIRTSLRTFGQDQAIVVRQADNTIIKGNGRHQAMILEGWTQCAVLFVDDDEIKAMARGIADNRSSESSGWDDEILLRELKLLEPSEWTDSTGFSESDIGELAKKLNKDFGDNERGREAFETGDARALIQKWNVQIGKLWQIGQHRLICADSSTPQAVANLFQGERFHLLFTELPEDHDLEFMQKVLSNSRFGIDLWTGYICGNDHYLRRAAASLNIRVFQPIVWIKNKAVNSEGFYKKHHEFIQLLGPGALSKDRWFGDDQQDSTWQVSVVTAKLPQQPVELPERAIRNSSNVGEIVFDPFGGLGTTMMAAHLNNRACYSVELDPIYCAMTLERMSQIGQVGIEQDVLDYPVPEEPEKWHSTNFSFSESQYQIIRRAIDEAAKDMSGSNVDARAIEFICADFLGK